MGHGLPQHVVKRAQGGSDVDLDQLVALCRACHDQTDAPFMKGRLIVTAMGGAVFTFDRILAASKWEVSRAIARAQSPKGVPPASPPNPGTIRRTSALS